jgi:hypothetical protein
MKTFSQFELKKQNIVEKELFSDKNRSDINDILNKYFGSEKKSRETAKKIVRGKRTFPSGSFDPANQEKTFVNNEKTKNLSKDINKRLSADLTRGDQARSQYNPDGGYGDSNVGDATQNKAKNVNKPTTNTVKSQTQRMSDAMDKPEVKDAIKNKRGLPTKQTSRGTRSYKPPSKTLSQNIQTKSIINQANKVKDNLRTVDKTINPNVSQGSGSGITVNKGGGATTSTSPDLNKIVNRKSTNIIDKVFGSGDTKVSVNLKEPPKTPRTINKVINPDVKTKPKSPTPTTTVNQIKTQTQQPLKGFKQFRADSVTRKGVKNVTKGLAGKASKVLGVAGLALDAGVTFRDTYKRSQAQGHSKQRSIGKSLAKIGGGIVGGALGGTIGSAAGPAGSFVGAAAGYAGGKEFGARAFDKLTTQQGRDELKQSFKNFRKRAMRPVGT